MPLPLYLAAELRALESATARSLPSGTLMDRAGAASAQRALAIAAQSPGPIVALAGPGNNGGDALTAAAILREQGVEVHVATLAAGEHYRGEAAVAWQRWQSLGGRTHSHGQVEGASIVLDGLFGIGLNKAVPPAAAQWITDLNTWSACTGRPVLALDLPSGLTADTGQVLGCAVRASHTLTFLGSKPGLYTGDGPDYCGTITLEALEAIDGAPGGFLVDPASFEAGLRARTLNSNKGTFGNVGIVGGAPGMVGAAILCARMALFGGAGRVYVVLPGTGAPEVDWLAPELMLRKDLQGLHLSAAVIGPGLGDPAATLDAWSPLLERAIPIVLDADALNAMAAAPDLAERVRHRRAPTILTPHPLEAARLLHTPIEAVQADRIKAARTLAGRFQALIVLKGAGSVLATPEGAWAVNGTGNPGLASAGTGDVLSGLIGALLAQAWPPWEALLGAVWLHGRAADDLVAAGTGPIGLHASELFAPVRHRLNALVANAQRRPRMQLI